MQNNIFFGHYSPRNVIVLEQTSSTNDYAKQLLTKFKPQSNLTAIMAKSQSNGRGQRGTQWSTLPNQNLTVSIILAPKELSISSQYYLTTISSLAAYDTITKYSKKEVKIKWPNDIYIEDKKVAGILIENKIAGEQIKYSIFGIGINVLQTLFPEEIAKKTTSIILENPEINVTFLSLIQELQERITYYLESYPDFSEQLLERYNDKLFRKDVLSSFIFEEQKVSGVIRKVGKDGLLQIEVNQQLREVDLKGITYII